MGGPAPEGVLMGPLPAGSEPGDTGKTASLCRSLHRVAVQSQHDPESCSFYHQAVVPCLLGLALQAALQGECGAGLGLGLLGSGLRRPAGAWTIG